MPKPNMGLQIKRRTDRPGIWEVGKYERGRWKRLRTGLVSAEDAKEERYKLERAERVGHTFELSDRKIGHMIADFIEERGPSILSKTTFDFAVLNLTNFWGERTLSHISEATCNAYYPYRNEIYRKFQEKKNKKHNKNNEIKDISNGTVGRELRQFRAMIQRDFDMGRIIQKPKVWIKQESYRKPEIPTRREVILAARKSRVGSCRRKYILIAFYTCARKGAVLSLRWPQVPPHHVDFNTPGTPQSHKKRPIIPMNRKLKSYMRIWRKFGTDIGPVIHENQRPIKGLKSPPKNLRHAGAVQMLISGIPVYLVAKYLGNSEEMILEHYGHLIPGHLKGAADSLG